MCVAMFSEIEWLCTLKKMFLNKYSVLVHLTRITLGILTWKTINIKSIVWCFGFRLVLFFLIVIYCFLSFEALYFLNSHFYFLKP